jgi:hypothetical protein
MKTKRAIAILGAIVVPGAVLFLWGVRFIEPPIPRQEDVWVPQNVVVLDSAQVRGSEKAFVFQYDIGALGYSITMASVGRPSHVPGSLVLSGSARSVWWRAPDTLMVQVTSDSYELSQPPKGIVVVPTHDRKPGP